MDDLPELPFEKVLSYLSLRDRLRLSAVSRSCHQKVINSRVKTLCYSSRSSDLIFGKSRWISGAFAQNFISSTRFASFFDTFGQTILSTLKRLRLCDLDLSKRNETALARTLNSFGQLEELDVVRTQCGLQRQFKLNLPMLTSIRLEEIKLDRKLTLEAPRLRDVKLLVCSHLRLEIVHGESVEWLLCDRWGYTEVKKLKNLRYMYFDYLPRDDSIDGIDSTFLSSLEKLKEIHTNEPDDVSELFEQKQRSGRVDLKIYLYGLLLNGPDDPARNALRNSLPSYLTPEAFACLAENPSRLADEIPFYSSLYYFVIEPVTPGLEVDLLKRFTHLKVVKVHSPVQNTQRFLDLLKNCERIVELTFNGDQPQDLFDRLPEYCAVQKLILHRAPPDLTFLFRLNHLIRLHVGGSIDSETARRAFDELPFLSCLGFCCPNYHTIEIGHPKQFRVLFASENTTFSNLNAAIEFIFENEKPGRPKKRKTEALE